MNSRLLFPHLPANMNVGVAACPYCTLNQLPSASAFLFNDASVLCMSCQRFSYESLPQEAFNLMRAPTLYRKVIATLMSTAVPPNPNFSRESRWLTIKWWDWCFGVTLCSPNPNERARCIEVLLVKHDGEAISGLEEKPSSLSRDPKFKLLDLGFIDVNHERFVAQRREQGLGDIPLPYRSEPAEGLFVRTLPDEQKKITVRLFRPQ